MEIPELFLSGPHKWWRVTDTSSDRSVVFPTSFNTTMRTCRLLQMEMVRDLHGLTGPCVLAEEITPPSPATGLSTPPPD